MENNADFATELEALAFEPKEVWLEKLYNFTGFQPIKSSPEASQPTQLLRVVSTNTTDNNTEKSPTL